MESPISRWRRTADASNGCVSSAAAHQHDRKDDRKAEEEADERTFSCLRLAHGRRDDGRNQPENSHEKPERETTLLGIRRGAARAFGGQRKRRLVLAEDVGHLSVAERALGADAG